MKGILFSILIIGVAGLLAPFVAASDSTGTPYRIGRLPVVTHDNRQMGTLVIQRRGDILYTDYDFSLPSNCYVESIETWIHSAGIYRQYVVNQPGGQSLDEFADTYIAPNDAVLAFNVGNQPSSDAIRMSAHVRLNCDGYPLSVWPSASNLANVDHPPSFVYRASRETYHQEWWPSQPEGNDYSRKQQADDGYELYYDERAGEYAYRNRHQPTPHPSSTNYHQPSSELPQAPLNVDRSGDGYELYYDERSGEYAFRNRLQSNARSRNLTPTPVNTDRAGDGYVLSWDNFKNWWYWRNVRTTRSS